MTEDNREKKAERTRYHLLDALRGIMIIGVVIFHTFVDMAMFGHAPEFVTKGVVYISAVATLGRVLFILLAGICCRLSRNNIKRAGLCAAAAALVSIVTFFVTPDAFIYCGILHFLALAMFIYAIAEKIPKKRVLSAQRKENIKACVIAAILAVLAVITWSIENNKLFGVEVDKSITSSLVGYLIGFSGYEPQSADWFPIFPWIFVFFSGAYIGKLFASDSVPKFFTYKLCPPLCYIGRHTLIIYLAHQPIVYLILMLIYK